MAHQAASLQGNCEKCALIKDSLEVATLDEGDWREPLRQYLQNGVLPNDKREAEKLRRRATRYTLQEGMLWRKGHDENLLRCLGIHEQQEVMDLSHQVEHQGGAKLCRQLLTNGYFWPTMEADCRAKVKRCQQCQFHGNLVHAPAVDLHALGTPWPFHTWSLDFIGPIRPPSHGCQYILTGTEQFTKWVEAVPIKLANALAVIKFIQENIVYRFGIPNTILSDNGTPFVNRQVAEKLMEYRIRQLCSTPYYPKGNGQAEATNKTLLRILSKMVSDDHSKWADSLQLALWAYRTSPRTPTGASPFLLCYGAEAVVPAEVRVNSARLAFSALSSNNRDHDLILLEEKREQAQQTNSKYADRVARAYNRTVRYRDFAVGDLVLKASDHCMRDAAHLKFAANWEGPFEVRGVAESGYCNIRRCHGTQTDPYPVNMRWLKKYFP